ncbi:hypothetical protein SAMN05216603_12349 [Pseudomonas benzenivorans]|nr:hypothetical protein [Pseudomonas benzenivorans]SDI16349.1 hypothetical protein SAMN05216603_12349 [Pseudomonas benzenivorans]
MIKYLLTAATFLGAVTAQAEPCVTNEVDESLLTAEIAFAIGNCHLAQVVDGMGGVPDLQYAHSWFLKAQQLGSSGASDSLKMVGQKLDKADHTDEK